MYDQLGRENMERMEQAGGGTGPGGTGGGGFRGNPFEGGGGFGFGGGPFGGGGGQMNMEDIFEQFFGNMGMHPGMRGGMGGMGISRLDVRQRLRLSFMDAVKGCEVNVPTGGVSSSPLRVQIPAGVDSGQRLVLQGQGQTDRRTGRTGNIILEVEVEPHPVLRKEGEDIHCEVTLPFVTAILGGELVVPTIDGDVALVIRPGTQPGTKMMLKGRGVPHQQGFRRGSQYVTLKVTLPQSLTPKQKEILEEFRRTGGG